MGPWILPHFFGQISNGLPMAGVSKHAGVYFVWYSTKGTSVPSGVLFCKSFERVVHLSVPFHKYFEHPYLLANQLNSNLYVFWPIKIEMSKVGARVATGGEVLRQRSPSGSRGEIVHTYFKMTMSTVIFILVVSLAVLLNNVLARAGDVSMGIAFFPIG